MTEIKTISGTPTKDTGYTKLCTSCNNRFGEKQSLIGKPRDLQVVDACPKCTKEKPYASLQ